MKNLFFKDKNSNGFSLLELLISVTLFSLILLAIISLFFSMIFANSKTKADREALENARRALEKIVYEVKAAKSIYTPTTTQNQLSLETSRYLPPNETNTFIDFFLCGTAICLKKEFQDPVALTSENVAITNLEFSQLQNSNSPSIKISLTASYTDPAKNLASSVVLTSTASLRSY